MSRVKCINTWFNKSRDYIVPGINDRPYNYYMVMDGMFTDFFCKRKSFIRLLLDKHIKLEIIKVIHTVSNCSFNLRIFKFEYLKDDVRFKIFKDMDFSYLEERNV